MVAPIVAAAGKKALTAAAKKAAAHAAKKAAGAAAAAAVKEDRPLWPWLVGVLAVAAVLCSPLAIVLLGVVAVAGAPPANATPLAVAGLDPVVLTAYVQAAQHAGDVTPGCQLRWSLLAGIGQIESNNAAGRAISATGDVTPAIIGIALNGTNGTQLIHDTDHGAWDNDLVYDRAVGPMQILPSTFAAIARDGNGDAITDPNNIFDAALTAAAHLCGSTGRDLTDRSVMAAAVFAYNHSQAYVTEVLAAVDRFDLLGANAAVDAGTGGGPIAQAAIAAALTQLGVPYSWGGGGPGGPTLGIDQGAGTVGFDCSGLMQFAYARAGVSVGGVTDSQYAAGPIVAGGLGAGAPGDLIFYAHDISNAATIFHVAMYLGGNSMVEAPRTGETVQVTPVRTGGVIGLTRPAGGR